MSTIHYLAGLLVSPGPIPEVRQIIDMMESESLSVSDMGLDMIASPLLEADRVVGEAYVSQLLLARRLAGGFDPKAAKKARQSLAALAEGVSKKFRWEGRFAFEHNVLGQSGVLSRGTHWRLKTEESLKVNRHPPPLDSIEPLRQTKGHIFFLGGDLQDGFEDFFLSEYFPLLERREILGTAAAIHQGARKEQQDYLLNFQGILPSGLSVKVSLIADGHYTEGKNASRMASWFFLKRLLELSILFPSWGRPEILIQSVRYAEAQLLEDVGDGGTTFSALLQIGGNPFAVNVGDSRGYFLPKEGGCVKVTIDHSGRTNPRNYHLLRTLGERGDKNSEFCFILAEPDIFVPTASLLGGVFLLATDGIYPAAVKWAVPENRHGSLQNLLEMMIREMLSYHDDFPEFKADNMAATAVAF